MLADPQFTGFEKQACTNLCLPRSRALLCVGLLLLAGALLSAGLEEEEKLCEAEQALCCVALLSGSVLDLTRSLLLSWKTCACFGVLTTMSESPVEVSEALAVLCGSSELAASFWVPLFCVSPGMVLMNPAGTES